jgi:FkbM family methyltransferase
MITKHPKFPLMSIRTGEPSRNGDAEIIEEVWGYKIYSKYMDPKSKLIIDIGAHIGSFTVLAATTCPQASIFAYEPVKHNYDMLVTNVFSNKLLGRVHTFNLGVCDKEEHRTIYKEDGVSTSGGSMYWGKERKDSEVVTCTTLDKIFLSTGVEKIDFLKLDCEGAEFEILYSSQHLLDKIAHISMEVHVAPSVGRNDNQLKKYLEDNGFIFETQGKGIYHTEVVKRVG